MEEESMNFLMEMFTKGFGRKESGKGEADMFGQMESSMLENGKGIKWMERDVILISKGLKFRRGLGRIRRWIEEGENEIGLIKKFLHLVKLFVWNIYNFIFL